MITSNRKFGIEIEFVAQTEQQFANIRSRLRIVEDGSLRPLRNAGEYVSNILQGNKGEMTIHSVCEVLKKYGADASNPATSVHVHLDGMVQGGELRKSRSLVGDGVTQIAISNKLNKSISQSAIRMALTSVGYRPDSVLPFYTSIFDGVQYLSMAPLTRKPRINYTYYYLAKPDRFEWLQKVFYFYTKFSDVMENIVSNSRRFGNMYCIPLGLSYDLDVIEGAKNMNELRQVWYKGRSSGGHYDDSRYHNVNLHCFWDRHGTVEIRSHGGTIDPHKILLWTRLHQKIVDKLEDISLNELKSIDNTPKAFVEFVEEELLQEYVKRLLGYYSGISIK